MKSRLLLEPFPRTIPAHAGEPRRRPPARKASRDYPRACGGTCTARKGAGSEGGLSPRMRGNLSSLSSWAARSGTICQYRSNAPQKRRLKIPQFAGWRMPASSRTRALPIPSPLAGPRPDRRACRRRSATTPGTASPAPLASGSGMDVHAAPGLSKTVRNSSRWAVLSSVAAARSDWA